MLKKNKLLNRFYYEKMKPFPAAVEWLKGVAGRRNKVYMQHYTPSIKTGYAQTDYILSDSEYLQEGINGLSCL